MVICIQHSGAPRTNNKAGICPVVEQAAGRTVSTGFQCMQPEARKFPTRITVHEFYSGQIYELD